MIMSWLPQFTIGTYAGCVNSPLEFPDQPNLFVLAAGAALTFAIRIIEGMIP
jgi:hypothetical protein